MRVRFLNQGETGLICEFGTAIDAATSARVTRADRCLQAAIAAGQLDGVIEVVPAYRSLTLIYDPLRLPTAELKKRLPPLFAAPPQAAPITPRRWCLPACYEPPYGPDLEGVAHAVGLSPAEVVARHTGRVYTVYMIGFLPGFPYMGDLDQVLEMPRHSDPRVRVPRGSVAIAGLQTAVYPWESPGGWQLLGRCPLPLFDAMRNPPALLAQGDFASFLAVSAAEFRRLEQAAASGNLELASFAEPAGEGACLS